MAKGFPGGIIHSRSIVAALVVAMVSACSTTRQSSNDAYQASRYSQKHDSAPTAAPSVEHVTDAVPVPEVRTAAGNKSPYVVRGKKYRVLPTEIGYRQKGEASWYGSKFHGHATSNGEIYNMYAMTAAHKSLPIPSYVQVTNLANGKKVIVRINDRGPFHGGRIIDLSYAAAKKLGYLNQGTAKVEVIGIDPVAWQKKNAARLAQTEARRLAAQSSAGPGAIDAGSALPANTFLQVGAFSSGQAAEKLRSQLAGRLDHPVRINPPNAQTALYRVRIGPLADKMQVHKLRSQLAKNNIADPHLVYGTNP